MAKQTRTTLKGYFETGDTPSQAQYADLIDSKLNLSENNTGNIQITGNLTASGNISASGTVSSQNFILGSGGSILATDTSGNTNDVIVGNLADVGLFFGDADMPSTFRGTDMTIDAEADIILDAKGGNIEFKDEGSLQLTLDMDGTAGAQVITPGVAGDDIIFKNQGGDSVLTLKSEGQTEIHGNITASGNISASGTISAFGSSSLTGLPTSKPSITGSLWLSGSAGNQSQFLVVFNP